MTEQVKSKRDSCRIDATFRVDGFSDAGEAFRLFEEWAIECIGDKRIRLTSAIATVQGDTGS